jgi:hypothetical protein
MLREMVTLAALAIPSVASIAPVYPFVSTSPSAASAMNPFLASTDASIGVVGSCVDYIERGLRLP